MAFGFSPVVHRECTCPRFLISFDVLCNRLTVVLEFPTGKDALSFSFEENLSHKLIQEAFWI